MRENSEQIARKLLSYYFGRKSRLMVSMSSQVSCNKLHNEEYHYHNGTNQQNNFQLR